jgi:pre-mRNA-splicing factor SYF2
VTLSEQEQQLARDALYRDANTLLYGDNKPTEDAIDRVVSKLNQECAVFGPAAALAPLTRVHV